MFSLLAQTVCEAWIFKMFVILLTLHEDVVCVQLIPECPFFFPIKDSLRLIVPVRAAKMDFCVTSLFHYSMILPDFVFKRRRNVRFGGRRSHQVKPPIMSGKTASVRRASTHTPWNAPVHMPCTCAAFVLKRADSRVKELDICYPNHLRHLLSLCAEQEVSPSSTKAPFTHHPYLSKHVSFQLPETTSSLFHPS